jgi:hypothetical protein
MEASALQLPAAIQLALASGYAGYLIAYRGIREHHKTVDTAFLSLVFSLAATGIAWSIRDALWPWVIVLTFTGTIMTAVLWRTVGIDLFAWIARASDLSWADDTPSSWAAQMANSRYCISQVAVLLDDDTWLHCDDTRPFADLPFGPCRLGTNGDLSLYLTRVTKKGEEPRDQTVVDPDLGARLTYVPASRIKRVSLRHQPLVLRRRGKWLRDLPSRIRKRCLRAD